MFEVTFATKSGHITIKYDKDFNALRKELTRLMEKDYVIIPREVRKGESPNRYVVFPNKLDFVRIEPVKGKWTTTPLQVWQTFFRTPYSF